MVNDPSSRSPFFPFPWNPVRDPMSHVSSLLSPHLAMVLLSGWWCRTRGGKSGPHSSWPSKSSSSSTQFWCGCNRQVLHLTCREAWWETGCRVEAGGRRGSCLPPFQRGVWLLLLARCLFRVGGPAGHFACSKFSHIPSAGWGPCGARHLPLVPCKSTFHEMMFLLCVFCFRGLSSRRQFYLSTRKLPRGHQPVLQRWVWVPATVCGCFADHMTVNLSLLMCRDPGRAGDAPSYLPPRLTESSNFINYIFMYLAPSARSCSMQDLHCITQDLLWWPLVAPWPLGY